MKLPIVFSPGYDITLFGLEKLHPFDSSKYGKVYRYLRKLEILDGSNHHLPKVAADSLLLKVHSKKYLKHLRDSQVVAAIAEMRPLKRVPNCILQNRLLRPMRLATQGSVMGVDLALKHGWAINLAGGYHHAKAETSSGFCFFADINLAANHLWEKDPEQKIMVLDLDAHQGNGFESVFNKDSRVAMFDIYNGYIYPQDHEAAKYIKYKFPIKPGTETNKYLDLLKENLPKALDQEKPGFLIYNAGTDIYEKDPLGGLAVSEEGILERDRFVFEEAKKRNLSILMLLSGGYTRESSEIIGKSIHSFLTKLGFLQEFNLVENQPV